MAKNLLIVESPAKAKKIQEYLGSDYVVKACYGHILELAKGGRFGLGVDIEKDFTPHYVLMEDKVKVLDELMQEAKLCDCIYLASDPDLEGEAISWSVAQRLIDFNKPMKRITFNEIKKATLLKAIKEAHDIDDKMVNAQKARRVMDRLIGFQASPYLANSFASPKLSAGRVQSVVTRMITDKEREIEVFKPEEFWTIQASLSKDKKTGFLMKYSGRPTNSKDADAMKAKLSVPNVQFIVSEVIATEEAKYPQPPLITSTLQRIMSKDFGMSADKTMKSCQALYEDGHCTYIRTDSVRVEPEALKDLRQFISDNKYTLPKKPHIYKNKDAAQDAHECIRPTDLNLDPDNNFAIIDQDEKLVYRAIWRYFVASQMQPALYDTLKVSAHIVGDTKTEVKASGKALKDKGFLEILKVNDTNTIDIPLLTKGDILEHFGKNPIKMEKKQTQPPARFSEDKLIKELVNRGIGRPSTYATLLSTVSNRNYVEKRGTVFHATDLGKKITDELLQFFSFMNYNYTSSLEGDLDEIEHGKTDYLTVMKSFYAKFSAELKSAYSKHAGQNATNCDKCSFVMIKVNGKFGEYYKCANTVCKNKVSIQN